MAHRFDVNGLKNAKICMLSQFEYAAIIIQRFVENPIYSLKGVILNSKEKTMKTFMPSIYPFTHPIIISIDEAALFISGKDSKKIIVVNTQI
jgi:hypothetical protein